MTITVYSSAGSVVGVFSEVTSLTENTDGSFSFTGKKNGGDGKSLPWKFQASGGFFYSKDSGSGG